MKRLNPGRLLKLPTWALLLILYGTGVALRFGLALALSNNVSIVLDEALYTNLMRSLWTTGSVTFRSQPVIYDSLLYPLLLSPLYALPQSVNVFRAIQLVNALLMNAAVFPAFFLAERITGKRGAALLVAALSICLPDMAMVTLAMTESLGYPLLLLTLLLCYDAMEKPRLRSTVLAAALCFLLYFAKPGMIAIGVAFCAVLAVMWIREKDTLSRNRFLAAAGTLVGGVLLHRLACTALFGVNYSDASFYSRVWAFPTFEKLVTTLNGVLLYALFFAVAAVVFPLVVPVGSRRLYPERERRLLDMSVIAIVILVLGICLSIYHDEYTGSAFFSRVHLRYLFPFIPVLLAFSLSGLVEDAKPGTRTVGALCFFLSGMVAISFGAIKSGHSVDNMSIYGALRETPMTDTRTLFQFLFLFGVSWGSYVLLRRGWTRGLRNAVLWCFVAFCLVNNISTYARMDHNNDPQWTADARQVALATEGGTVLNVAEDGAFLWNPSTTLDTHVRKPMYGATMDDLLHSTQAGGRYAPFTPSDTLEMSPVRREVRADWLVVDQHALSRVLPYEADDRIVTDYAHYYVLPLYEGRPWIHSGLSGLVQREWVTPTTSGWLHIFDEALCAQETITVWLNLRAGERQTTVTLRHGEWESAYVVDNTLQWIEAQVPTAQDGEPVRVEITAPANVYVETYQVQ